MRFSVHRMAAPAAMIRAASRRDHRDRSAPVTRPPCVDVSQDRCARDPATAAHPDSRSAARDSFARSIRPPGHTHFRARYSILSEIGFPEHSPNPHPTRTHPAILRATPRLRHSRSRPRRHPGIPPGNSPAPGRPAPRGIRFPAPRARWPARWRVSSDSRRFRPPAASRARSIRPTPVAIRTSNRKSRRRIHARANGMKDTAGPAARTAS